MCALFLVAVERAHALQHGLPQLLDIVSASSGCHSIVNSIALFQSNSKCAPSAPLHFQDPSLPLLRLKSSFRNDFPLSQAGTVTDTGKVRADQVSPPEIDQPSRLFNLPGEIHNRIWPFVFDYDEHGHPTNVIAYGTSNDPWVRRPAQSPFIVKANQPQSAALRTTCRHAYAELSEMYYANSEGKVILLGRCLRKTPDIFLLSPARISHSLMRHIRFVVVDVANRPRLQQTPLFESSMNLPERLTITSMYTNRIVTVISGPL